MSQRRGATTDQLANLIEILQMGRKTGTLTVVRGENTHIEEGVVTFVNGQITEAYTGRLKGQAALKVLMSTWGVCRFTFVAPGGGQATAPLPSVQKGVQFSTARETNPRLPTTTPLGQRHEYVTQNEPTEASLATPYRTVPVDEALRLLDAAKLSRTHRRLLMLIDGRRTVEELVRLLGRRHDEVQKLLRDLAYIKVIQ